MSGREPALKEALLAILTKEGQSYKELQAKIETNPSIAAMNLALRKLEAAGLAVREKISKRGPGYSVGISVDRVHEPRVLWRLK
jgi:predicted transcriptional regulator